MTKTMAQRYITHSWQCDDCGTPEHNGACPVCGTSEWLVEVSRFNIPKDHADIWNIENDRQVTFVDGSVGFGTFGMW
jgi:hypothetical protein